MNMRQATMPVPVGDTEAIRSSCLSILEYLARDCDISFDRLHAEDILQQAEREIPGEWRTSWIERITRAAHDLGLRVDTKPVPLLQAGQDAADSGNLVTFIDDSEARPAWVLLDGKRAGLVEENQIRWTSMSHIRQRFDAQTIAEEQTWITAEPLAPCQPLQDEPKRQAHHGPSPMARLFGLLRQDKNDIWVVVLFSLGVGIFSLATPIAVEAIVTTVQGGTQILLQPVIALSIVLLVFLGLAAFLRVLQAFVVEFLQQRIFVRVVADLAYRLPRVKAEALNTHHGPELVNRFFDVLTVQKASAVLLLDGLSVVLQTGIGLLVLAFFNPYLLGFDLVLIGSIAFIIFVLGRGGVRTSIDESYAKYDVAGWLEEMARHPLTFKMGIGRSFALRRADQLAGDYIRARRSHFKIVFRQILFALTLQAVASAALFGLGGWLVINRGLTLGQLVAAELILTMVVGSFVKLGKSLESYYDLMAGTDKLGHLIDLPLEKDGTERLPRRAGGAHLQVRDLTFSFASGSRKVFDHLNLDLAPGERVALLGPHGSGKSVLLDLIYGVWQQQHGRVDLDGQDIRDLRHEDLRSHVATVKGLEIFEGPIIDNIRVGRSIALSDVRKALKDVGLLDDVMALPQGLQTRLSTGGVPLSYGQARRLMLARAMVGQPRLLLVDEVIDEVREEVREQVLDALLDENAPWTLLLITNRPEIAERCHRQVYLNKGKRS